MSAKIEAIRVKSALTPTGGFLKGFTHTFSPAIGCLLGKSTCGAFCYAAFLQAHKIYGKGAWGDYLLVKENAADALRVDLERAARRPPEHKHSISNLRVFSASSTEPLAGPLFSIYRDCLRVAGKFPIGMWALQTRSPLVRNLVEELLILQNRAIVSMTLETDCDEMFQIGAAGSPTIAARRAAVEFLYHSGIRVHIAVSPALPIANPADFAKWILQFSHRVTVDTAVDGDGTGTGARSQQSRLPELLNARGVDWRDGTGAREFYQLLVQLGGARAGWSSAGFARMARPTEW